MRIKIDDDQVTPKQKPVAFSVMDIDGKRPPHSDYQEAMIQHFRLLHSVLVKTASTKELNKDPLNSNELIDFMIDKDGRLLLMCVLALATGKTSFDLPSQSSHSFRSNRRCQSILQNATILSQSSRQSRSSTGRRKPMNVYV